MNILLTGGSGFLGKRILNKLFTKDYNVYAPRSTEMDLMDIESIKDYISDKRIDIVINSAAYYGGLNINLEEPVNLLYKNSQMISNLYYAIKDSGVIKTIAIGSSCAYPVFSNKMKESQFLAGPMHDTVFSYGFSKRLQLYFQKALYKQYNIKYNHLILANLYGPNDDFGDYRGHAISIFIRRIIEAYRNDEKVIINHGTGKAIREFLYVEDAAEIISRFVEYKHDDEPINIGPGTGISIKKLNKLIKKLVGYRGKIKWDKSWPDGTLKKIMDNNKLLSIFPDIKFTSLKDGLKKTIEWYMENK